MGAKRTYDPEMSVEICERIARGEPLRAICREEGMPSFRTVYEWIEADEEIAARFARAREVGADAIAEEAMAIVDTEPEIVTGEGGTRRDSAHVAWLKNRAEMRLKLLAKWQPKKYGDRQTVEHAGNMGLTVVTGVPIDEDASDLAG